VNKPRDMLEFLRRASGRPAGTEQPASAGLEATPRMVVLRRSQVVVAGAVTAGALLLAFLVGMAAADRGAGRQVYVIRAASFQDDAAGRQVALTRKRQLEQMEQLDLGEVQIVRDPALQSVAVTVGAWESDPSRSERARSLLGQIQRIQVQNTRETPFRDASFWRIER